MLRFVFALALVLRAAWALWGTAHDPFLAADPLHGDARAYESVARSLLAGQGYSAHPPAPDAFLPPLYPFFLALVHLVFGPALLPVRLAQALLGAAAVALCTRLADRIVGPRVAQVAGLGLACHPFLIYWGNWLIAEAPFFVLQALILLQALHAGRRGLWRSAALLGAASGAAALAKPAFIFTFAPLLLWLLVVRFRRARTRSGSARAFARALAVVQLAGCACVAAVLPWTVRNTVTFGELIPIAVNGGYTFYGANNPDAFGGHAEGFPPALPGRTPAQADREYYRLGVTWIAEHPDAFVRVLGWKLARLWLPLSVASTPEAFPLPYAPAVYGAYGAFLALAALGAALTVGRRPEAGLLLVPVGGAFLSAAIFYGDTRYALPMVPSLVTFAAAAMAPGTAAAVRLAKGAFAARRPRRAWTSTA